jgi:hypothetical protein
MSEGFLESPSAAAKFIQINNFAKWENWRGLQLFNLNA